jgi:hypothetical protein
VRDTRDLAGVAYGNSSDNCKDISVGSGRADVFVPTGRAADWTAFRNNAPNNNLGVSLTNCTGGPVCNNNGSQDNGETGVDCGGGGCAACGARVDAVCGTNDSNSNAP